jgi:pimeloyl-ACP methyl ester carboxylesterase
VAKTRMRDLVVLLPGITGSVLARAGQRLGDKPVDVWAPSGQAVWQWLKTLGGSVQRLEVPPHDPRHAPPDTGYLATRVVQDFHGVFGLGKIDGYTGLSMLIKDHFLVTQGSVGNDTPANFFEFPYDWRLSSRHSGRHLRDFVDRHLGNWRASSGAPDAKVILIAHSMGGLVSRYYLEVLEGWKDCRALITFGTPYRGAVNATDFIANGYKEKFTDLQYVLRSCPAVYELFPIYKAVSENGAWLRVSECTVPNAVTDYVTAASEFHEEIKNAVAANEADARYLKDRYRIIPYVGVSQPTLQSATLTNGRLRASWVRPDWMDEPLEGGDGTVPRVSAVPIELSDDGRETFFGDRHAALQNNEYALDDVRERIKQMQAKGLAEIRGTWRAGRRPVISLALDDLYLPGEAVELQATVVNSTAQQGLVARIDPAVGGDIKEVPFVEGPNGYGVRLEGLAAGLYRVRVRSAMGGETTPTPVRDLFEIAGA